MSKEDKSNPIAGGFRRLGHTFHDIRRYRELMKFLLAFWVYNDGIGTIVKLSTIYGSEIGIGTNDLVGALLLTQFVGVPSFVLFGRLARRLGPKTIHLSRAGRLYAHLHRRLLYASGMAFLGAGRPGWAGAGWKPSVEPLPLRHDGPEDKDR